jgi:diketogulonate reductase-like aldo/keto reductase
MVISSAKRSQTTLTTKRIQSQKDPKMTISSAKRSQTTLTTHTTLSLMQIHALKKNVGSKGLA